MNPAGPRDGPGVRERHRPPTTQGDAGPDDAGPDEAGPDGAGPEDPKDLSESSDPTSAEQLQRKVDQLTEAMRSRAVIEQAKGVLMSFHGCSAGLAWQMLTDASQDHNVRVRDLAAAVMATVRTDGLAPGQAIIPALDALATYR